MAYKINPLSGAAEWVPEINDSAFSLQMPDSLNGMNKIEGYTPPTETMGGQKSNVDYSGLLSSASSTMGAPESTGGSAAKNALGMAGTGFMFGNAIVPGIGGIVGGGLGAIGGAVSGYIDAKAKQAAIDKENARIANNEAYQREQAKKLFNYQQSQDLIDNQNKTRALNANTMKSLGDFYARSHYQS